MSSSPSMPSSLSNPTCPVNGGQVSLEVPEELWPVDRPQTPAPTWTSGHIGAFQPFQSPGWGRSTLPRQPETVVEVEAEVHPEPKEVQEEEVTKVTVEDLGPEEGDGDNPDQFRQLVEEAANNAVEEAQEGDEEIAVVEEVGRGVQVEEETAGSTVEAGLQFQISSATVRAMIAAGLASRELMTRKIVMRDK